MDFVLLTKGLQKDGAQWEWDTCTSSLWRSVNYPSVEIPSVALLLTPQNFLLISILRFLKKKNRFLHQACLRWMEPRGRRCC